MLRLWLLRVSCSLLGRGLLYGSCSCALFLEGVMEKDEGHGSTFWDMAIAIRLVLSFVLGQMEILQLGVQVWK